MYMQVSFKKQCTTSCTSTKKNCKEKNKFFILTSEGKKSHLNLSYLKKTNPIKQKQIMWYHIGVFRNTPLLSNVRYSLLFLSSFILYSFIFFFLFTFYFSNWMHRVRFLMTDYEMAQESFNLHRYVGILT